MVAVKVNIIGTSPAGLLFALLIDAFQVGLSISSAEHARRHLQVFGVVFSLNALAFLERDVPDFRALFMPQLESWPTQRIVHRDERVEIDGNGFSAIGRLELNRFLDELCRAAGVDVIYNQFIESLAQAKDCDLRRRRWCELVRAPGPGSGIPTQNRSTTNRFAWYGTTQPFECLSLTFRATQTATSSRTITATVKL